MTTAWLITGVSSGLGRSLAEAVLERGDRVAGTIRRPASVSDLAERFGDAFEPVPLELTQAAAIPSAVRRAWNAFGRIDVVVNNAGYGLVAAAEEASDVQVRHKMPLAA